MCRLYGYFSSIETCNHHRLLQGETDFVQLSKQHGDGWGVAYFNNQQLFISKATSQAVNCPLFTQVGRKATGQCLVAHLRKATTGQICMNDTHPFRFKQWVFVHNGNIKDFSKYREQLKQLVSTSIRANIQGQTDSELIFFILLSELEKENLLDHPTVSLTQCSEVIMNALHSIQNIIGSFYQVDGPPTETYLSFILTNGKSLFTHQGGKPIYWLFQDVACHNCFQCTQAYYFSSEPLPSEGIWQVMKPGELIALDQEMLKLNFSSLYKASLAK